MWRGPGSARPAPGWGGDSRCGDRGAASPARGAEGRRRRDPRRRSRGGVRPRAIVPELTQTRQHSGCSLGGLPAVREAGAGSAAPRDARLQCGGRGAGGSRVRVNEKYQRAPGNGVLELGNLLPGRQGPARRRGGVCQAELCGQRLEAGPGWAGLGVAPPPACPAEAQRSLALHCVGSRGVSWAPGAHPAASSGTYFIIGTWSCRGAYAECGGVSTLKTVEIKTLP